MKMIYKKIISLILSFVLLIFSFSFLQLISWADEPIVNKFDPNTAIAGWINGSGQHSADNYFYTSDYIAVNAGDVLTFGPSYNEQGWHIARFNSSKTAIGDATINNGISIGQTISTGYSIMTYTVTAGTAYIRIVCETSKKSVFLLTINRPFSVNEYNEYITGGTGKIVNEYNVKNTTVGWIDKNGNQSSDTSFLTSDYIAVKEDDILTFGAAVTGQGWHLVKYNSSKQVIGDGTLANGVEQGPSLDSGVAIMYYTVQSDTSYVRMVVDAKYKNAYLVTINRKYTPSEYTDYFKGQGGTIANLFDNSKTYHGYIDENGTVQPTEYFRTSDFISVALGDVITFAPATNTQGWHIVLYDSNKKVIGTATLNNGISIISEMSDVTSIMQYAIGNNICYIRMVAETNYASRYLVTKNYTFTLNEYKKIYGDVHTESVLYQKSVLFCGDSVSHGQWDDESGVPTGYAWAGRIGASYGMDWTNVSLGGASLSTIRGTNRVVNQFNSVKTNTYDYVIMQGGINDAWGDPNGTKYAQPGVMTESKNLSDFDTSTYAGGLEELFYYATQYYPNAILGYIISFKTPKSKGIGHTDDMEEYYSVGMQICRKWNVQYIDMYHDNYVNNVLLETNNVGKYMKDSIHPNGAGYDNLSPYIAQWMESLVTKSKINSLTSYKAIFAGDSISYGSSDSVPGTAWAGRLQSQYGMWSTNVSRSGWSVSTIRAAQIVSQLYTKRDYSFDYVILQGGTNDGWDNGPVGAITPDDVYDPQCFDLSTFAGALENLFYTAYQLFPNTRVGYMSMFKMPGAASIEDHGRLLDMSEYYDVADQICKKWNVYYLDMYNDTNLNDNIMQVTTNKCIVDGVHPNAAGYDCLYGYIGDWMKTMTPNDISAFKDLMPDIDSIEYGRAPYGNKYELILNDCEKLNGWSSSLGSTAALSDNCLKGEYSLMINNNSPVSVELEPNTYCGAMEFLTLKNTVDLSGYDYLEYDIYLPVDVEGGGRLQFNFISNDNTQDGYNTYIDVTTLKAGWNTVKVSMNDSRFITGVEFDITKTNRFRLLWFNNNPNLKSLNFCIDNIRLTKDYVQGDVDENGETNATDALLALKQSVNLIELNADRAFIADVNKDGVINAMDALMILRKSLNK